MYFSLIRLRKDIYPKEIAALIRGNVYQLHELIWDLFSDGPEHKRDFIYRYETVNRQPTFYTVSAREPKVNELWETSVKDYNPKLAEGDRLAFKLRVNPVRIDKKERTDAEIEQWLTNRQKNGRGEKSPTKKRIRHDVVMEAKKRIGFKELPDDERPHVATLIQEAGIEWLKDKGGEFGFLIDDNKEKPQVRADGYCQHRFFKGRNVKPISFTTLEFNGILTVTNPDKFVNECLFKGIGPAKGFGCGLMMVKRV
jgi:CRISPR system Cascade subunit CasE